MKIEGSAPGSIGDLKKHPARVLHRPVQFQPHQYPGGFFVFPAHDMSPYPTEFRRQIIESVRAGRTPAELSREFRERPCSCETAVLSRQSYPTLTTGKSCATPVSSHKAIKLEPGPDPHQKGRISFESN